MEKKIKDYLHLYLGCECQILVKSDSNVGYEDGLNKIDGFMLDWTNEFEYIKPILRPLSDMTEEERIDLYCVSPYSKHRSMITAAKFNETKDIPNIITITWSGRVGNMTASYGVGDDVFYLNKLDSEQHRWLLSNHFDLFGLIDANIAIDKTQLNK